MLDTQGRFDENTVADYAVQLCAILSDLHSAQPPIIHRDIKPSNIIISPDGVLKLIDVNAAKRYTEKSKRDTALLGTLGFAAPEQYGISASSVQTDLFAVGALMNVMLCGDLPTAQSAEGRLSTVIRKCLELNPTNRYHSAEALANAVKAAMETENHTGTGWKSYLPPGFRSGNPAIMILSLVGYILLILLGLSTETPDGSPASVVINRIAICGVFLSIVLFSGNYLDVQRFIPFAKSKKPWVRVIVIILVDVAITILFAQDGILPERFAQLNEKQIPVNTILLVLAISLPIPFLGRTAIGWIVDTTTIGATILYGFASAAVFKVCGQEGIKKSRIISGICLGILFVFAVFLLLPSFFSDHTIETDTYVLMSAWSFIGLVFFNYVIRKDHARNFGKAIIVWIALLAFIMLVTMTWVERVNENREDQVVEDIHQYFHVIMGQENCVEDHLTFLDDQRERLHDADNTSVIIISTLFGLSLDAMFINYFSQQKWEKKANEERDEARSIALTDPMTGVKSKHAFLLRQKAFDAAITDETTEQFAVAVCDVNGLKVINDTLGHKAGDEYIISASRMICDIFQHSPVFRTGGDEFVVILTGRDYLIRKELVLALHDRSVEHISTKEVVISGGLSDYRRGEDTCFRDVFERADALMYKRKMQLKGMGAKTRDA